MNPPTEFGIVATFITEFSRWVRILYESREHLLFFVLFSWLMYILYKLQVDKKNQINLADLLCTNGFINDKKFHRTGAFVVTTWVLVYTTLDGNLQEWYALLYGSLWVGNALWDRYYRYKENIQLGEQAPISRGAYELGEESVLESQSHKKKLPVKKLLNDDTGAASKLEADD